MSVVLDASALLALLQREPGSGQVAEVIDGAFMSTVNWAEVAAMAVKSGADVTGLQGELQAIGLVLEAFTASREALNDSTEPSTEKERRSEGRRHNGELGEARASPRRPQGAAQAVDQSFPRATAAGRLRPVGKPLGLSLADRACLALAMERKLPVLTTDRVWSRLQLGIEVRQVR